MKAIEEKIKELEILVGSFAVENTPVKEAREKLSLFFHDIRRQALEESKMGVSQWCEYGKKYGYWDYFRKQALEEAIECAPKKKGVDSIIQLGVVDQATQEGKLHYQREYGKQEGYNQAIPDYQSNIKAKL
jgi:hypothetical protein